LESGFGSEMVFVRFEVDDFEEAATWFQSCWRLLFVEVVFLSSVGVVVKFFSKMSILSPSCLNFKFRFLNKILKVGVIWPTMLATRSSSWFSKFSTISYTFSLLIGSIHPKFCKHLFGIWGFIKWELGYIQSETVYMEISEFPVSFPYLHNGSWL
jgi:hypothetical protein